MPTFELDGLATKPVVLVVDDEPGSLKLLCDTLGTTGYTVLVARDGESAMKRLSRIIPDAILMDALMPGLSGFDTCRQIKSHPEWMHIPIIFMTGLSETTHVLEGFDSGGVDYVVKPLRIAEVIARLRTHIHTAREVRLAHTAIDRAGLSIVRVDEKLQRAWCSPHAMKVIEKLGIDTSAALLAGFWLDTAQSEQWSEMLDIRDLGETVKGEILLLISCRNTISKAVARIANAALTPRETEVLSWIAKGKTDREIGDILGISPRTVNKHLEHTFTKLGVETRAAAAALASQQVSA
ncbi:DNA-binding response regulator [Granulosicoccus antarcticus]|uniref:Response regulator PleD n=1 Tax=Granulosicoccus antarcticus IMCC3135 TaxID=1192854 RepID=A0A2Z2P1C0_9GAMM|nr:DNA-binding response regulator [Granulosicoccus antarcticus]ASJ74217.1 Response regulator PleD [Granulosicoccus antarcticus IMCC3135]